MLELIDGGREGAARIHDSLYTCRAQADVLKRQLTNGPTQQLWISPTQYACNGLKPTRLRHHGGILRGYKSVHGSERKV